MWVRSDGQVSIKFKTLLNWEIFTVFSFFSKRKLFAFQITLNIYLEEQRKLLCLATKPDSALFSNSYDDKKPLTDDH